jgi:hypothetical protein
MDIYYIPVLQGGGGISKIMLISLKYDTFYSNTQLNHIIEYII